MVTESEKLFLNIKSFFIGNIKNTAIIFHPFSYYKKNHELKEIYFHSMEYLLILIFNYIFLIYFLSHKFMKLCVKWVCEFQIIEIDHFMRYGKNRWWPFTFPNVSFPPSCMKNISWEGIPSIESPMIEFCSMYYLLQYIRIIYKCITLQVYSTYLYFLYNWMNWISRWWCVYKMHCCRPKLQSITKS